MKKQLDQYVGRIVRLNQDVFYEISKRTKLQGVSLENYFLVAEVSRQMRKLVCYGSHLRVVVGPSDVILI